MIRILHGCDIFWEETLFEMFLKLLKYLRFSIEIHWIGVGTVS